MATATITTRPPLPPFTPESAIQKVRFAADSWNTRDPAKAALAYAIDSRWRNRSELINGRNEIIAFDSGHWYRSYGNENWEFNDDAIRHASINDRPVLESDRKYHWPLGRHPDTTQD